MAATTNNPESSRSHVIVTFSFNNQDGTQTKLYVGDLAGVENKFDFVCDKETYQKIVSAINGYINSKGNLLELQDIMGQLTSEDPSKIIKKINEILENTKIIPACFLEMSNIMVNGTYAYDYTDDVNLDSFKRKLSFLNHKYEETTSKNSYLDKFSSGEDIFKDHGALDSGSILTKSLEEINGILSDMEISQDKIIIQSGDGSYSYNQDFLTIPKDSPKRLQGLMLENYKKENRNEQMKFIRALFLLPLVVTLNPTYNLESLLKEVKNSIGKKPPTKDSPLVKKASSWYLKYCGKDPDKKKKIDEMRWNKDLFTTAWSKEKKFPEDSIDSIRAFINGIGEEFISLFKENEHRNIELLPSTTIDIIKGTKIIKDLKLKCDFIVLFYHGGIEHFAYPSPRQREICHYLSSIGVDLITCQHSHIIGASETYGDSFILYGQGNYLFESDTNLPHWNKGLMLEADFELGKPVKVNMIPISNRHKNVIKPVIVDGVLGHKLLQSQMELSENLLTSKYHLIWDEFSQRTSINLMHEFIPIGRIGRKLLKSTGLLRSKYFDDFRLRLINKIECEAHVEPFVSGLKRLEEKN